MNAWNRKLKDVMATTLCRVCLNSDIRLQSVSEIYLDTYEKLTNIKLSADTECGMPSTVCYICHRQLQRCHTFSEMAHKSNRVLQEWLCNGTQMTNNALVLRPPNVMQTLVVTPTVHCSCTNLSNASSTSMPVKEEPVSVKFESDSNKETSDYDDIDIEECMLGHMRIHTAEKPYSCNRCDKTFSQKCNLTNHMRIHTEKKLYSCDRCDKTFSKKSNLTVHKRIHTGDKPYSCNRCDKTFGQKCNLTNHMRIHTEKKLYSCDRCDKTFSKKSKLTVHKRIHTGDKPYSCDRCDKTFSLKGSLTRHMLTHTGVKPYSCDSCGKTFSQKCHLTIHMLTHTGVKRYSCDRCDKMFSRKSILTKHMVTYAHRSKAVPLQQV